ncbi:MAG: hypothetical protein FWE06_07595 [Oscillospiraceae bacterium]|nr:hypothetical protein [Oscillospiraceae bacterium]
MDIIIIAAVLTSISVLLGLYDRFIKDGKVYKRIKGFCKKHKKLSIVILAVIIAFSISISFVLGYINREPNPNVPDTSDTPNITQNDDSEDETANNHLYENTEQTPLTITSNYRMLRTHSGPVIVESGTLTINGILTGRLTVLSGANVVINGTHTGSLIVYSGAEVTISGVHTGSITNNGRVTIRRGTTNGSRSGNGEFLYENP